MSAPLARRVYLILEVNDLQRHYEKDAYVISREAMMRSNVKIRDFFNSIIDDALLDDPDPLSANTATALTKKMKSNEQVVLYGPGNRVIDLQD